MMNHMITANQPLHRLRVFYDTTSEKSRLLFFQPVMSKKRTILSLDQQIEVMYRLGEAHHVEHLLPSHCVKTQMASKISKQTGNAIVAYVEYEFSLTGPTIPQLLCCINFSFPNYSIHNYDNACIQYEYRWW